MAQLIWTERKNDSLLAFSSGPSRVHADFTNKEEPEVVWTDCDWTEKGQRKGSVSLTGAVKTLNTPV